MVMKENQTKDKHQREREEDQLLEEKVQKTEQIIETFNGYDKEQHATMVDQECWCFVIDFIGNNQR